MLEGLNFYEGVRPPRGPPRGPKNDLGYAPLLSEYSSFPVDPDLTTVDNCKRRVSSDADIFVLIIGARYGSIPQKSNFSVTNLEYLAAKAKGIPIFAFVSKEILGALPVWRKNPDADFSGVTDNPKIFKFIEEVRGPSGLWTFPFETVEDITTTLRHQFAHAFLDSLRIRSKFTKSPDQDLMLILEPEAARTLLERSPAWEHLLFMQVWRDQVAKKQSLLASFDARLFHGIAETVPQDQALEWLDTRIYEIKHILDSANHLINTAAKDAFGPHGQPGNAKDIIQTAIQHGEVLDVAIDWAQRVGRARVASPFDQAAAELARALDNLSERIRNFPNEVISAIQSDIEMGRFPTPETPIVRRFTLTLNLNNLDKYNHAFAEAVRRMRSREF